RPPGVRRRAAAGRRPARILAAVPLLRGRLVRAAAGGDRPPLAGRPRSRARLLPGPGPGRAAGAPQPLEPVLGLPAPAARAALSEVAAERQADRLDVGRGGRVGLEGGVR